MVKINEIPVEEERVELSKLPEVNVLLAVREEWRDSTAGKTGGLIIWFKQKDGKQFPQKYSKISGKAMVEALKALGYDSTEPLFKYWHEYKLTAMRTGYPRYIPVRKVVK